MTLEVWYWLLMALWLFYGIWQDRAIGWPAYGGRLLYFLLFVIIGWRIFGAPVK